MERAATLESERLGVSISRPVSCGQIMLCLQASGSSSTKWGLGPCRVIRNEYYTIHVKYLCLCLAGCQHQETVISQPLLPQDEGTELATKMLRQHSSCSEGSEANRNKVSCQGGITEGWDTVTQYATLKIGAGVEFGPVCLFPVSKDPSK